MKKLTSLFFALACIPVISCMHDDNGNINIAISESDHYYSMKARFSTGKTRDVEEYLNNRIGTGSKITFANSSINGKLALDDNTTIYLKKYHW